MDVPVRSRWHPPRRQRTTQNKPGYSPRLPRILTAQCAAGHQEAPRGHSLRGARRRRRLQLWDSPLQAGWTSAGVVRRLETSRQPVPDDGGDQAGSRGRPRGIPDLEGHDPISTDEAPTIDSREAAREGTYRRVTKQGPQLRHIPLGGGPGGGEASHDPERPFRSL